MGAEPAQISPEEAQAFLMENVYVPVFLEKCAAEGIRFSDEDELVGAIESSILLRNAESGNPILKEAHAGLRQALLGPESMVDTSDFDEAAAGLPAVQKALAALRG